MQERAEVNAGDTRGEAGFGAAWRGEKLRGVHFCRRKSESGRPGGSRTQPARGAGALRGDFQAAPARQRRDPDFPRLPAADERRRSRGAVPAGMGRPGGPGFPVQAGAM